MRLLDYLRSFVSRRPGWVVGLWVALAVAVGGLAPDLTRLAAEGQANLMGREAESLRAADLVRKAWPDQSYESLAVAALHRDGGLTAADRDFARRLVALWRGPRCPGEVLRVLGPGSPAEVVERLKSGDGTIELLALPMKGSYVAPATHDAVSWLQASAGLAELGRPAGLEVLWTGDAVVGRDYMANVRTSLDRVAVATVGLLLVVLMIVYRSIWLTLVPLLTIGLCLVISRGILAWMTVGGWEISPLVELFLVAILFGTGTDFCLFVSWRFAENFTRGNPAGAMRVTLRRSFVALMTSAGTVIVGLALMGTTQFKLFSSTGPSVAIGLALTLVATLTLTPSLLVLLAHYRPRAFVGLSGGTSQFWERLGQAAMARPILSWSLTVLFMLPCAVVSLGTTFAQDLMGELPRQTPSTRAFRLLATKFKPGMMAPLTVVLDSDIDFRDSRGLALIDEVSRLLARQRQILEVRSATQPLGSPATLARARIASRLGEVNAGFSQMAEGAGALRKGLVEGAAKLRAALWLEQKTGLSLTPGHEASAPRPPAPNAAPPAPLLNASAALLGGGTPAGLAAIAAARSRNAPQPEAERPQEVLLRELTRAAEGAGRIADGAELAHHQVSSILANPVGQSALDRLLVDTETIRAFPELARSFSTYISPDGHHARIELVQEYRVFSGAAMDQVQRLRRRLDDHLGEVEGMKVTASIAGANAESVDVRTLTRSDQVRSWIVVPIGVFLVLLLALRDPVACVNLVATMVLTYGFALGATHLVFVTMLGVEGIDWKVPYFLFVLLVAVGVDYNVFLMDRVRQESGRHGLRGGILRAIAQTGGLISSAAAITACSFASFISSPLISLRQLGFALVVGITVDAVLVRPLLVPCGHWILSRRRLPALEAIPISSPQAPPVPVAEIVGELSY